MSAGALRLVGDRPEPPGPGDGSEEPITVVLGEDHPAMRSSLRSLLQAVRGLDVVGEAGDLALTWLHVEGHRPDVLVLDLRMPDGSSMDAISELRKRMPSLHVVVVSVDDTPGFAQRALTAGASGYVLKDRADEDLPAAVAAAARGEEFVSEPVATRVAQVRQTLTEGRLSGRETEVLRLIALGHTNSEIAEQLTLSPRTIETHRAHIHRKLGVKTRAELVGYALRCGLLGT